MSGGQRISLRNRIPSSPIACEHQGDSYSMAAFLVPQPLCVRHNAPNASCSRRNNRWYMKATPPKPPPLPTTDSSPLKHFDQPLPNALYNLFSKRSTAAEALSFLPENVVWSTPLFEYTRKAQMIKQLSSFLSFSIEATLAIYTVSDLSFTWTLSFIYPLPWRPRVAISGTTTLDNATPKTITDTWIVSPATLLQQALPTLVDFLWLFPAPHAETDRGQRRTLKTCNGYNLVQFAESTELRFLISTDEDDAATELLYCAPTLPEPAFIGGLRKREKYSTSRPMGIRVGQEILEMSVPVPGAIVGSSITGVKIPVGGVLKVLDRRVMAVKRFSEKPMRKRVIEIVDQVLSDLERDGIKAGWDRVWVRNYDCKVGFNTAGELAMAMYGTSFGVPRVMEVAVDVTDLVDALE